MTDATGCEILSAIQRERDYQDRKYPHEHSVGEYLLIMEKELEEAKQGWMKGGDSDALREILQVVAVGVAAMEDHGIEERTCNFKKACAEARRKETKK
jgi:hypothetical protein